MSSPIAIIPRKSLNEQEACEQIQKYLSNISKETIEAAKAIFKETNWKTGELSCSYNSWEKWEKSKKTNYQQLAERLITNAEAQLRKEILAAISATI